ncbi:MAG: hypothetical protein ACH0QD_05305 [Tepidibacillus sp.]
MASGRRDPMICPHCENYYEYKGEVCLEDGILVIKFAIDQMTKKYLEGEIRYITSFQTSAKREKTKESKQFDSNKKAANGHLPLLAV